MSFSVLPSAVPTARSCSQAPCGIKPKCMFGHKADQGHPGIPRKEEGSDYLWRSSVVLQKNVEPQLCQCKNFIDKSIRLLLTSGGPIYVNKAAIGDSLAAKRVLNIYYDLSFAEMLLREIVLHHSNAAFLSGSVVLYFFSSSTCLVFLDCRCMAPSPSTGPGIWQFAGQFVSNPHEILVGIVEVLSPPAAQLRQDIFHSLEQNEGFVSLSIDVKIGMTVQGQASYRSSAAVRTAACFGHGEAWQLC